MCSLLPLCDRNTSRILLRLINICHRGRCELANQRIGIYRHGNGLEPLGHDGIPKCGTDDVNGKVDRQPSPSRSPPFTFQVGQESITNPATHRFIVPSRPLHEEGRVVGVGMSAYLVDTDPVLPKHFRDRAKVAVENLHRFEFPFFRSGESTLHRISHEVVNLIVEGVEESGFAGESSVEPSDGYPSSSGDVANRDLAVFLGGQEGEGGVENGPSGLSTASLQGG